MPSQITSGPSSAAESVRLHLGCGQRYLQGYVNIDFPLSEHTVQQQSVADQHADITRLKYDAASVSEIRLHHVFEHFKRPVACALLVAWRAWLRPGGLLHIEVPDFTGTAISMMNPIHGLRSECVGARHLFGSNEAAWATHYEGWSRTRLSAVLTGLDFQVVSVKRNAWKLTHNIEVVARRSSADLSPAIAEARIRTFLSLFLVDESPMERSMLDVWISDYRDQLLRSGVAPVRDFDE